MLNTLVVLPTYNESENIGPLCHVLLSSQENIEIFLVDDSPNSDTVNSLKKLLAQFPNLATRVMIHKRSGKMGRGSAIREGFKWGVSQNRFSHFVEMDCDFSHDPKVLDSGLKLLNEGWDFVVGSRYPIGERPGWPISRRILSYLANHALQIAIPSSIKDYTSGYRFYNQPAVERLLETEPRYSGFIYLSEVLSILVLSGIKMSSFPICHPFRRRGNSTVGTKELLSSLIGVVQIGFLHWRTLLFSKISVSAKDTLRT